MTESGRTLQVAQLSDTHFLEVGEHAEGGFAYDTSEAFDAVLESMAGHDFDLVTVTGDVADHGRTAQYQRAAAAFQRIDAPVNVCPGNHDQDAVFTVAMGRPTVSTSRVVELGDWCFLFADSNAGVMAADAAGRMIDPAVYEDRLHGNGSLGATEAAWIKAMHDETAAEHVFIWIHHPPAAPIGLTDDADYAAEWQALMPTLPKVRGMGTGHTHVPGQYEFDGRPVFMAPALKNNFDLQAATLLPPGYRTYAFSPDGGVTSELQLTDDDRWPRHRLGRAVMALMHGELTFAEFDEIVARKNAG